VRTSAGWLYLAPVIDLFSRRVVGCAMSTEQDGRLSVAALASALEARGNPRNVVVHSDRGGIFGDRDFVRKAQEHGMRRSMSRTSNPWDNAVIESFFSTLTFELLERERYGDTDVAQRSIAEWVDDFYNTTRRHTSLGNMSPVRYELACQMRKRRT
jgi:putative transposase